MAPTSNSRGFTLIEALMALAVVTTGVLALVGLAQHVTETVTRSRRLLAAAVLADEYVAQRGVGALAATAADCLQRDRPGCVESIDETGRVTATAPVFLRRWRVAPVAGVPAPAWSISVCVVPIALRHVVAPAPGVCVTRVVAGGLP